MADDVVRPEGSKGTIRHRQPQPRPLTRWPVRIIFWQDLPHELPGASWWEPLDPIAGEYAESDKAALLLRCLDEQIHHGADLGVVRDLYQHDAAKSIC